MLLVVAVGGALALEVVTLHGAGESLALGHGDGVDQLPRLEEVGGQLLSDLVVGGVVEPELDQAAARVHARPVEMALLGLGQGRRPPVAPGHLEGRVALSLRRLDLDHPDRRHAHHRHRYRPGSGHPRSVSFRLFRPRSPWWPLELLRLDSLLVPTQAGVDRYCGTASLRLSIRFPTSSSARSADGSGYGPHRLACRRSARRIPSGALAWCGPRSPPSYRGRSNTSFSHGLARNGPTDDCIPSVPG